MADREVTAGQPAYAVVAQVIRQRRTSLLMDPMRPVPDELVDELIELATWAPNHHRTWPWRFAVVTGDGRQRLGDAVAEFEARRGSSPERCAKARAKYLRAPVVVLIGLVSGDEPVRRAEDRDAVAAAVQTILIAATASGLASHWATGEWMGDQAVTALAGFEPAAQVIALLYLGWPTGSAPPVARPAPRVARLT